MTYLTTIYLCYGVSFPTLNAISYERFIALTLHLRYKAQVTKGRVIVVTALIWILNTFLTCLRFAGINRLVRAIHMTLWLLCLLISGVFQSRIVGIVRRHQNDIRQQEILKNPPYIDTCIYHRQLKLAANIAYIVGIYIFLNLPLLVATTYHQVVHRNLSSYNYYSWAETVALLNSSLNPLVRCWRARNLRKAIVKEITA